MTEPVHWVFPCPEMPAPVLVDARTKFAFTRNLRIEGLDVNTLEFESVEMEHLTVVKTGDLLTACGLIPLRTLNPVKGETVTCMACLLKDLSFWPEAYTARFAP